MSKKTKALDRASSKPPAPTLTRTLHCCSPQPGSLQLQVPRTLNPKSLKPPTLNLKFPKPQTPNPTLLQGHTDKTLFSKRRPSTLHGPGRFLSDSSSSNMGGLGFRVQGDLSDCSLCCFFLGGAGILWSRKIYIMSI